MWTEESKPGLILEQIIFCSVVCIVNLIWISNASSKNAQEIWQRMKSLNEPISDNEMYADYLKNGSFGIFWTVLIIGGLIEYALAFEKKYSNLKYDTN